MTLPSHHHLLPLLLPLLLCQQPHRVSSAFSILRKMICIMFPLPPVYEMESDTSEVYSVAASDRWCRMVQCYDLYMNDGEQEVIECPLSACEVHDLTMFDAYKADQDWVSSAGQRSEAA